MWIFMRSLWLGLEFIAYIFIAYGLCMFKWLEIEAFRSLRQKLKISFDESMLDNQTAHFLHSFRKTAETVFL